MKERLRAAEQKVWFRSYNFSVSTAFWHFFPYICRCSETPETWCSIFFAINAFQHSFKNWKHRRKRSNVVADMQVGGSIIWTVDRLLPPVLWCDRLTVSHLAFIFSFSNLANSRRSWIIMSSFQMRSKARPISTMPATTPATMGMMSGPAGHSKTETTHRNPIKSTESTLNGLQNTKCNRLE